MKLREKPAYGTKEFWKAYWHRPESDYDVCIDCEYSVTGQCQGLLIDDCKELSMLYELFEVDSYIMDVMPIPNKYRNSNDRHHA